MSRKDIALTGVTFVQATIAFSVPGASLLERVPVEPLSSASVCGEGVPFTELVNTAKARGDHQA